MVEPEERPVVDNESPEEKLINGSLKNRLHDQRGKIGKNYTVAIDGNDRDGAEFIKETNKTKFPPYK